MKSAVLISMEEYSAIIRTLRIIKRDSDMLQLLKISIGAQLLREISMMAKNLEENLIAKHPPYSCYEPSICYLTPRDGNIYGWVFEKNPDLDDDFQGAHV
jgi:hypothetical protein